MAKNVYRLGKKAVSISASGALNLRLGRVRLSGSRLEVKLESGRGIFPLRGVQLTHPVPNDYMPGGGVRVSATTEQAGLAITLNAVLPAEGPWVGLCVEIRNLQRAVISLQRVTLLGVPLRKIGPIGSAPKPYMLVDSGLSGGYAGLHALSGGKAEDELEVDVGQYVTALFVPGGNALVVGSLLGGRSVLRYAVERDRLQVVAEVNGEIPAHGSFETDLLLLGAGENLAELLRSYAAFQRGRRRAVEAAAYHAWTSSQWYATGLSESDIMDNLEFLKETPWLRDNVRYVVVGRGWQRAEGDWEPNERFPSLMDTLAGRINDAGFSPGVWVAPLQAARKSSLAETHPEWLLKPAGKTGEEKEIAQLDYTLPEVRDFVYHTFQRLSSWGYRYVWTDFSGVTLDPKLYRYRGKHGSLQECLRAVMTAVRAAIGETAFWVASNVPFGSVSGLCDAVSVAPPAGPYFSTIMGCARAGIYRSHFHGGPWLNEPGLLIVCGPETAAEEGSRQGEGPAGPYRRYEPETGPMLSREEARLWATWIITSGGILTLGDRPGSLKAEGLEILRKTLTRAGTVPAVPLDLGVVPLPRIWQRLEGSAVTLALFNWSETEQEIVVTERQGALFPADGELYEVWKDEMVRLQGGVLKRRLPPRSCELFEWEISASES